VKQSDVLNAASRLGRDELKVRSFPSYHRTEADDRVDSPRSGQQICSLGKFKGTGAVHNPDVTRKDALAAQAPFGTSAQFSGDRFVKATDDNRDFQTAARGAFF
jgi:hypothetical protein